MTRSASPADGTKLWGGRFDRAPDKVFYEFQRSFAFDKRLLPYELEVDRAWAAAIEKVGILTAEETRQTLSALDEIERRAATDPSWTQSSAAEDVHHFVELALVELLGPVGFKLHTGRSRNELVATDFRMFVREAAAEIGTSVRELIGALSDIAEQALGMPVAGMTHLQHAQPLLISHYLLAHAEAYFRDLERIAAVTKMADSCPLGAGALGGCVFPIDREALARKLGFSRVSANSLDTVGDRDFALDFLYALATIATHLSRLAEDFVLFSSQEFGFVVLPDEYSTGSSLMPQKKNPDVWELLRGKTGRINGALVSLLVTLKGLPSSYQRDLQEDKEPVFAAYDQTGAMLRMAAGAVSATRLNEARLRQSASDASLLATEVAHYLVRRGLPFRQAHEVVGKMVKDTEQAASGWNTMSLEQFKSFSPLFEKDIYDELTVEAALDRRDVIGGTAPNRVRQALAECRKRLGR